jgi:hypothetical protein
VYRLFFITRPPVYITRELQLSLVEYFGGRSVGLVVYFSIPKLILTGVLL